ncbi:MAG: hypothetical protein A3F82_03495 [Deltaproteobacteria bacterium RIFCSPLOWO2_12_FULL_44_12]|nr:MAG: hypothetical protein A2712_05475 [Deltaproteobacteria bacterium RIFCSPHIGHO2_01_FULL_43_49]OGQ14347.1 MAG: hypothetical protein A3D22_04910 [Deltaproteobacteria bacterium RIFCSPHIGHO2_02_FULL_44_53]OGQ27613.1 MAG: hypothetical protein A3D98_09265 [Deltaproteobacteria bacterium RIFCSPHIGHO2_12_FULL_44_21]OGQ30788.1 MAG: hypothetical protein A2979_01320 [Deltaproteobacteria bacterium RIFCSPLOWO2_01_FULL_45_74]OGQ42468.1 MAG: hypothetical protein A3I70_10845 [Deltaproteobacteria bacterium 
MADFETDIPDLGEIDVPTGLDDLLSESTRKKQVVGSWGFHSNLNFTKMSTEETNVWFFEQVFNFLRAFFGLVVPDHMEVITYNAVKQIKKENLNPMTFLDELMLVMKNLNEPLWVIRLHLNLVGFLRTDWDPDNLVRFQIQEPANFVVWGGPDENGFQTFSISYALFSNQKLKGEDSLLWSINQPLLEKAMKKWEKQSGHRIEVVRGNSKDLNLYQHGFKEPAPTGAKPFGTTQQPEEPSEDKIPDLDDLDI